MTNAWTQPAVGHQGDGLAPQSDDEGEQEEDEPSTGLGNLAFRDVEEQAQLPSPISRELVCVAECAAPDATLRHLLRECISPGGAAHAVA